MTWLWHTGIPLALVKIYRLIPAAARGRVFGGQPSSGTALEAIRAGVDGWAVIRRFGVKSPWDMPDS
jgi:hypothetical protein